MDNKNYIIETLEGYLYAMKRDMVDLDEVKFNEHLTEINFFVNEEVKDIKGGFQHDAPFGEFPNADNGDTMESVVEEAMLSGDYSDLGDTMVSIALAAGAKFDYNIGADITDGASDDEI